MNMLSDDDRNLKDMSDEELAAAWDLWFDLAQSTNDADPPYTHGVFVNLGWEDVALADEEVRPHLELRCQRVGVAHKTR